MVREFIGGCLIAIMAFSAGCGGGSLSQQDMRRAALKRTNDMEEDNANAQQADRVRQITQQRSRQGNGPPPSPAPSNMPASRVATPSGMTTLRPSGQQSSPSGGAESAEPNVALQQLPRVAPPDQPLSLSERRERSIKNLRSIGQAMSRYFQEHHRLPASAISEVGGRQLLSWRVELLPYLGHEELYRHFRLNEPWDSDHNRQLLEYIPPEYQSPERFDSRSNYQVPIASFAAFTGQRAVSRRRLEDGIQETVVITEVDDAHAVPWTQPQELALEMDEIQAMLGNLRQDGMFVVWGDGAVGRIHNKMLLQDIKAAFTIDGGDKISALAYRTEPPIELPAAASSRSGSTTAVAENSVGNRPGGEASQARVNLSPADNRSAVGGGKLPLPDERSIRESKELFRDVYHAEYEQAQSLQQKDALAKQILADAERIESDAAGKYVLLDVALQIAVQATATETALAVADRLVTEYDVAEMELLSSTLASLQKRDETRQGSQRILDVARAYMEPALQEDDFAAADTFRRAAAGAATRLRDRATMAEMGKWERRIADAERAYKRIRQLVEDLEDASDPQTHFEVGHYYCVVKGDWEKGLPLLALSDRTEFQQVAEKELQEEKSPQEEVEIADMWWELAKDQDQYQRQFQVRAASWYQHALPGLPLDLVRIKVEMRLKRVEEMFGKQTVTSLSGQL